jgi:hypothetical protein
MSLSIFYYCRLKIRKLLYHASKWVDKSECIKLRGMVYTSRKPTARAKQLDS